ncbi:AraC family transcriptional regulator ligand-binding domain-containing protein [Paracoccus kondratievae]
MDLRSHRINAAGGEAEPVQAAPDPQMPLENFVSRLEQDRASSPDGLYWWRLGERVDLGSLGILGSAVAARRTLGEALRSFARGFPLLQSNSDVSFEVNGDEAQICYRVLDPRIWPRRGDSELTLGLIRGICDRYGVPARRSGIYALNMRRTAIHVRLPAIWAEPPLWRG